MADRAGRSYPSARLSYLEKGRGSSRAPETAAYAPAHYQIGVLVPDPSLNLRMARSRCRGEPALVRLRRTHERAEPDDPCLALVVAGRGRRPLVRDGGCLVALKS